MAKKLKGGALSKFEAGRNVWQEVLDGVREIKSGGGKRSLVVPPLADCTRALESRSRPRVIRRFARGFKTYTGTKVRRKPS
jgi:hypothetical protein